MNKQQSTNNNDNVQQPPSLPLASTSKLPLVLNSVLEIKDSIKSTKTLIVNFIAPWCGTCKKADPLYDHSSQLWSDSNATFTRFNVEPEEKSCEEEFEIYFVPSWKIWKDGILVSTVEGDWTEFEPTLTRILGPPTNSVILDSTTEKLLERNRLNFIDLSNSIKERKRLEELKEKEKIENGSGSSRQSEEEDEEVSDVEV